MSAYGAIASPTQGGSSLPSTRWTVGADPRHQATTVSAHHLKLGTAKNLEGLIEHLFTVFAKEVEDGLTYPQEGSLNLSAFEAYFFAADVIVAIERHTLEVGNTSDTDGSPSDLGILQAKGNRTWNDCVAGFYYVSISQSRVIPRSLAHRLPGQAKLSRKVIPRRSFPRATFKPVQRREG